ncbi:MAG: hypothetical protein H7840_04205 [Alphaproteobacteria bacterium]
MCGITVTGAKNRAGSLRRPGLPTWNTCITGMKVNPDPVTIATEGALYYRPQKSSRAAKIFEVGNTTLFDCGSAAIGGSIKAHGFLDDMVVVSDDAGQFNVGVHALCWVHAERLIHKLDAFTEAGQVAVGR